MVWSSTISPKIKSVGFIYYCPLYVDSGIMEMVCVDVKGRLVLPARIRREIGATRLAIEKEDGRIVLTPIIPLTRLGGRFRRGIKAEGLHDREDFS